MRQIRIRVEYKYDHDGRRVSDTQKITVDSL